LFYFYFKKLVVVFAAVSPVPEYYRQVSQQGVGQRGVGGHQQGAPRDHTHQEHTQVLGATHQEHTQVLGATTHK
jgi:hypothetical protein